MHLEKGLGAKGLADIFKTAHEVDLQVTTAHWFDENSAGLVS